MSVQVKRRRDTAANLASFVGAQAELLVDTTNNRVQVHDGTTAGGWPAAKLAEVVTNARTAVADADYAVLTSDRTIAYTALTAARVVSLSAASAYPAGTRLLLLDESGACSATNTVTVAAAGSDTIDAAASAVIACAHGYLALQSSGAGKWTIVDQAASNLPGVGIGTPLDSSNPLSVYGTNALFASGSDIRVKLNKAASSNTASFLFQDAWSGRAEIGLAGDDNFHFKVSPDGSTWHPSIIIDNATGAVTLGNNRTAISDTAYEALSTDRLIAYTALTAARIVTLPAASAFPQGTPLVIIDESGACSVTNTIALSTTGSDTIDGVTAFVLQGSYAYVALESDGSSKWSIINQTPTNLSTLAVNNGAGVVPGSSGGAFLYASNTTGGTSAAMFDSYSGSSGAPVATANLVFRGARGTPSSPSGLQTGDILGQFGARGFGSTVFASNNRAQIKFIATQNWTDSAFGCAIAFSVTTNGASVQSEVARIDNTGYVGFGTTTPAQRIDINGAVAIAGTTAVGSDRSIYLGSFTVATLPPAGNAGRLAFASDGRMYNGTGTLESVGAGTGGLVVDNGSAWKLAGTNHTVQS